MLTLIYDVFINKVLVPAMKNTEQMVVYDEAKAGLLPIIESLSSNKFICGDKVTLPDFMVFEAINYLNILGSAQGMSDTSKCFQDLPYLLDYSKRMRELPGLK